MAIRLPSVLSARHILRRSSLFANHAAATSLDVPKGHFAVYVGDAEKKRFVIPVSYLNHPSFQELLSITEEEFGFSHPMGGLIIPCTQEFFLNITSSLHRLWSTFYHSFFLHFFVFAFFAFQHVVSEKFTRAERFFKLYHWQRTSVQKEWITNITIFHVVYSYFLQLFSVFHCWA